MNAKEIGILGPAGNLEAMLALPASGKTRVMAIICHPHPLHEGTMQNKVVTTLHKAFAEMGVGTLRFNFRGVGKSDGVFDDGTGESQDLIAVIRWVQKTYSTKKIFLAGFSFGGAVAMRVANQLHEEKELMGLLTVAPSTNFVTLGQLNIALPWLIVQGDQDDVVPLLTDFVQTLTFKPQFIVFEQTGHFFHGKLVLLRQTLIEFLEHVEF